jgi:protein-tyrosine phosphatase
MDYDQILPELFVGSHPASSDEIDRLQAESDITAVLNVQTDGDMQYVNLDWGSLQAHYTARGIELRRVPVRDFDPVDLREKLPACVRVLNQLLAAGRPVYVHCTAGAGRSPSVVIAYLHWCRGWDLDEAVAHVKHRRPCSPNVEAIQLATQDLLNDPAIRQEIERRAHELFQQRPPRSGTQLQDWAQAERQVLQEVLNR